MQVTEIISLLINFITGFVTGIAEAIVATAETLMFVTDGGTTEISIIGGFILLGVGSAVAFWVIEKVVGLLKFRSK